MLKKILVATDLSSRSELAVQRAALLARQHGAELIVLNVVDDDQPADIIEQEIGQAEDVLRQQADRLADLPAGKPVVKVLPGDAFNTIVETGQEMAADVLVMGAHRKQILKDIFTGTTLERVIRTGHLPVLMVNQPAAAEYRKALLPVDLSDASAHAIHTARSLGFLYNAQIAVLHAFMPLAKDMMHYAGTDLKQVTEHVNRSLEETRVELDNFLQESTLAGLEYKVMLHEGHAYDLIPKAVEIEQPDLLIIGTHSRTGASRVLMGSVADFILRRVNSDILVVPPVSR